MTSGIAVSFDGIVWTLRVAQGTITLDGRGQGDTSCAAAMSLCGLLAAPLPH